MDEVLVAEARAADVDQIVALERASFPSPWKREFFESELKARGRHNRVLRLDRMIVGYSFTMHFLEEMHINKIAISESCRRRGYARILMDDALVHARATGVKTIALEVRESNDAAQGFYRSIGFESRYRRPRYYPDGENAVVMMLDL